MGGKLYRKRRKRKKVGRWEGEKVGKIGSSDENRK